MKYRITKYECKNEGKKVASISCDTTTDDIENFRKEVHVRMKCERVLLIYNEIGD
jgi:hypothetical protein